MFPGWVCGSQDQAPCGAVLEHGGFSWVQCQACVYTGGLLLDGVWGGGCPMFWGLCTGNSNVSSPSPTADLLLVDGQRQGGERVCTGLALGELGSGVLLST